MSKINCNIAGDLIPLYVDKVLSEDSVELLEEHLHECESCTAKVEALQGETVVKTYEPVTPLKRFRKYMFRHRVIIGVVAAAALVITLGLTLLLNYLRIVRTDYSYSEVKDHLKVVSFTDFSEEGFLITYDGEQQVFTADALINVVGHKNGRAQVELTFCMYSYAADRVLFMPLFDQYYNPDNPHLLMKDLGPDQENDIRLFGAKYPEDYKAYNIHGLGYDIYDDMDIDEYEDMIARMEIVRIYYGKENESPYGAEPFNGQRYLLWAKAGYEK